MAATVKIEAGISGYYLREEVVKGPAEVQLRDYDPGKDVFGETLPVFPDVSHIDLGTNPVNGLIARVRTRSHDTSIDAQSGYDGPQWHGYIILAETYHPDHPEIHPPTITVFQREHPIAEVTHVSGE